MLKRAGRPPEHIRLLIRRQNEQWQRAMGIGYPRGSQKRTAGFKWPCWICGSDGILGVDGFGAKGLVRPANIMHEDCYEELTTEYRRSMYYADRMRLIWMRDRRLSRRNLNRELNRRRRNARG